MEIPKKYIGVVPADPLPTEEEGHPFPHSSLFPSMLPDPHAMRLLGVTYSTQYVTQIHHHHRCLCLLKLPDTLLSVLSVTCGTIQRKQWTECRQCDK